MVSLLSPGQLLQALGSPLPLSSNHQAPVFPQDRLTCTQGPGWVGRGCEFLWPEGTRETEKGVLCPPPIPLPHPIPPMDGATYGFLPSGGFFRSRKWHVLRASHRFLWFVLTPLGRGSCSRVGRGRSVCPVGQDKEATVRPWVRIAGSVAIRFERWGREQWQPPTSD